MHQGVPDEFEIDGGISSFDVRNSLRVVRSSWYLCNSKFCENFWKN